MSTASPSASGSSIDVKQLVSDPVLQDKLLRTVRESTTSLLSALHNFSREKWPAVSAECPYLFFLCSMCIILIGTMILTFGRYMMRIQAVHLALLYGSVLVAIGDALLTKHGAVGIALRALVGMCIGLMSLASFYLFLRLAFLLVALALCAGHISVFIKWLGQVFGCKELAEGGVIGLTINVLLFGIVALLNALLYYHLHPLFDVYVSILHGMALLWRGAHLRTNLHLVLPEFAYLAGYRFEEEVKEWCSFIPMLLMILLAGVSGFAYQFTRLLRDAAAAVRKQRERDLAVALSRA